jgi:hypothetical protein
VSEPEAFCRDVPPGGQLEPLSWSCLSRADWLYPHSRALTDEADRQMMAGVNCVISCVCGGAISPRGMRRHLGANKYCFVVRCEKHFEEFDLHQLGYHVDDWRTFGDLGIHHKVGPARQNFGRKARRQIISSFKVAFSLYVPSWVNDVLALISMHGRSWDVGFNRHLLARCRSIKFRQAYYVLAGVLPRRTSALKEALDDLMEHFNES